MCLCREVQRCREKRQGCSCCEPASIQHGAFYSPRLNKCPVREHREAGNWGDNRTLDTDGSGPPSTFLSSLLRPQNLPPRGRNTEFALGRPKGSSPGPDGSQRGHATPAGPAVIPGCYRCCWERGRLCSGMTSRGRPFRVNQGAPGGHLRHSECPRDN